MKRLAPILAAATLAASALLLLSACQLSTAVPETPTNRYALVIGVQDYATINDLNYPDDDANDMAVLLAAQGWTVKYKLVNSAATYAAIRDDIAALSADPGASILVYYSGHGTVLNDVAYILPYDTAASYSYGRLTGLTNAISPATLSTWMAAVPAKRRVLILDSCYSGAFVSSEAAVDTAPADYSQYGGTTADTSFLVAALSRLNSLLAANVSNFGSKEVQVLSAAGSDEFSYDGTDGTNGTIDMKNGAFTYYLLQAAEVNGSTGLKKGDADSDGLVSVDEAYVYAKNKIKLEWNLVYSIYNEDFLPHISGGTGDLALYAGS